MYFFFFNDTATTEIYTLSLHDALPISNFTLGRVQGIQGALAFNRAASVKGLQVSLVNVGGDVDGLQIGLVNVARRSEEHTSELQSRQYLVCRLLLEKKNKITIYRQLCI